MNAFLKHALLCTLIFALPKFLLAELTLTFTPATTAQCSSFVEGQDLYIELDTFTIPDPSPAYNWSQIDGPTVIDSATAGGDGYPFLFIPADALTPCTTYQFEVTVTVTTPSPDSSTVETCPYFVIGAPVGGICTMTTDTSPAYEADLAIFSCTGWVAQCEGDPDTFNYSLKRFDSGGATFVEVASSSDPVIPHMLAVGDALDNYDVRFVVDVSNSSGATTRTDEMVIKVLPVDYIPATLEEWRSLFFDPAILADPENEATIYGLSADPDSDGLENVFERLYNLHPKDPSIDPPYILDPAVEGVPLCIQFVVANLPEYTLQVEYSNSLTAPGNVFYSTPDIIDSNPNFLTLKFFDENPWAGGSRYLRLIADVPDM